MIVENQILNIKRVHQYERDRCVRLTQREKVLMRIIEETGMDSAYLLCSPLTEEQHPMWTSRQKFVTRPRTLSAIIGCKMLCRAPSLGAEGRKILPLPKQRLRYMGSRWAA